MSARLAELLRSAGARQGLLMAVATLLAGGLDYVTQVVVGRLLADEIAVFLAVTAVLQVVVHSTNVIRNVVAYYSAELAAQPQANARIGAFLRGRGRWALRWGVVALLLMLLISPVLRWLLRVDTLSPLWAAALAVLLLFVRPVTDGALQGTQHFWGLGTVQVTQALLRLLLAPLLIWLGWRSFGAVLSLPLAMAGGLLLALWWLRPYLQPVPSISNVPRISWRYSAATLVGLLAFALMINLDAMMVQARFTAVVANNYGPVITLGKMNLFVPLGLGLVFFPKATQRHANGQDARPVLLLTMLVALLPGLALTLLYFLYPDTIVALVFGVGRYANPGPVLGLVGAATTLFAGVNIWLNYALSLERGGYVYGLAALVAAQLAALWLASSVTAVAIIMLLTGLAANLIGALLTLRS